MISWVSVLCLELCWVHFKNIKKPLKVSFMSFTLNLYPISINEIQHLISWLVEAFILFEYLSCIYANGFPAIVTERSLSFSRKETWNMSRLCLLKGLVILYFQKPTKVTPGYYVIQNVCSWFWSWLAVLPHNNTGTTIILWMMNYQ